MLRDLRRFLTYRSIHRRSGTWGIIGLVLFLLVLTWRFGMMIGQGGYVLPALAAFGLLVFNLLLRQPVRGLILAWVILVLLPYGSIRLPLPFLNSPLNIVVLLTLALAIGPLLIKRESLIPSNLYKPMAAWAGVLIAFALFGHGPGAVTRARWTLQGTWAFVLVVLLVKTPRQARNVFLALTLPFVVLVLLWLPGVLQTGGLSSPDISDFSPGEVRSLWTATSGPSDLSRSLLVLFGSGDWQTFSLMAMVWPILFSLALSSETRWLRWGAGLCAILILASIVLSTYGMALVMVAEGAVFVLAFNLRRFSPRKLLGRFSPRQLAMAVIMLSALGGLILNTASGQHTLQRILSWSDDPSVRVRQKVWRQGIGAFLASPLVGWGAHIGGYLTPSGHELGGHSSFIPAAYEYGLVYLVPLAILLFRLGQNLVRLGRERLTPDDRAVLIGIQALFGVYIVQGFVSGSMGIIGIDSVFWLCMGLVTVWLHWLKSKTYGQLVR